MHFEYPPFERAPKPLSDAEKRPILLAAMKNDLAAAKKFMAKQQLT
jgi:hypothetical protein